MNIQHEVSIWLGLTNGNDPRYLWWSGFFSALPVFGIFGFLWTHLRVHNCEVHGCWRIGRHDTAAGHTVCRIHHPEGAPTYEDVKIAHFDAKDSANT